MHWGNLLFGFSGRLNRGKYWLAFLVYVAINLILALLALIAGQNGIVQALNGMLQIVMFISSLAVGIKRLHDRDKSGWYLVLFYIVPTVLVVAGVAFSMTSDDAQMIGALLWLLAFAIGVWAFVELGCLRGTIGSNSYGPDPLPPPGATA